MAVLATHLLKLLEEDKGEAVAGGEADVGVVPPRVGVLAELAAAHAQQPRRIDVLRSNEGEAVRRRHSRRALDLEESSGLACVDEEQDFVIPALLPHLGNGIRDILAGYLFGVLEFQKFVSAMSRHINQDVASSRCLQPL